MKHKLVIDVGGTMIKYALMDGMPGNMDSETGQIFDIPFSIPHVQVDVCAHFNDSNLIGAFYHYTLQKELEKGEL